ncbi:hypothetical protein LSPH26S_02210 [Lysinibacillus sphaericus]
MRVEGIARAVVDGRHAQGAEAGHVGPAELGVRAAADGLHEGLGGRVGEAGQGAGALVVDDELRDVAVGEDLADVRQGLGRGAVGGVAVVDRDGAGVGDDVGGDAALDRDRVEALVVLQAVDGGLARLVGGEAGEDRGDGVDRVGAHPGARGVGPLAGGSAG